MQIAWRECNINFEGTTMEEDENAIKIREKINLKKMIKTWIEEGLKSFTSGSRREATERSWEES